MAAAELLAEVESGRSLDDAVGRSRAFQALTGRDRAFARAIVGAALRRLGGLDAALAPLLERPLPETARLPRAILRAAAAELLVLGAPPHAAVSEAVSAARIAAPRFAGLVNAVLRRLDREGRAAFAAQTPGADLPAWLFARWRAAYGDATAEAIAAACRVEPPLDLTVKAEAPLWAERLGATVTPTGAVRLPNDRPPIPELPGYAEGAWWVQDAAAALPARLLGDVAGLRVLDLCAAPGGKTLQLAAAGARVTALDIDARRLERLKANLARTGLSADIVCADAAAWRARDLFDAILLDAPCTATGTLRRRPDAAWLRRPTDVESLAALQGRLVRAALENLRPGGALVYAVCSLEPEEGPALVARLLSEGAAARSPLTDEAPAPFITPEGDLRTLPSHWSEIGGLDGFYAARLRRT